MVEAVVALPFMVLVFASVMYVQRASLARQSADAAARTCAWLYSVNGCSQMPRCPYLISTYASRSSPW